MLRKRRSTFWIVATHVLTTGLAVPTVAGLFAAAVIAFGGFQNSVAAIVQSICAAVGYIGGTYYSLSFLKKVADHEHWTDCTKPSSITFAVLAVLGGVWNAAELPQRDAVSLGILAVTYAAIIAAFVMITAAGFRRLSANRDESQPSEDETPETQRAGSGRMRGATVGFAVGVIVGMGIAVYLDGDGWHPRGGWEDRFAVALVVGVIAALLGLVSGPPRLS